VAEMKTQLDLSHFVIGERFEPRSNTRSKLGDRNKNLLAPYAKSQRGILHLIEIHWVKHCYLLDFLREL